MIHQTADYWSYDWKAIKTRYKSDVSYLIQLFD